MSMSTAGSVSATPTTQANAPGAVLSGNYSNLGCKEPQWNLAQGRGDREFVQHVAFSRRFDSPPQVTLGLTLLDADQGTTTRIAVEARDVTPEGFDLVFRTWYDSLIYAAGAHWLALAPAFAAAGGGTAGGGTAAPALDLTGEWVVASGDYSYALHLTQRQGHLSGTYEWEGGTIDDGSVQGHTVRFRWNQTGNRRGGPAEMMVAPDGQSMAGTWWYDPAVYNSGLNGSGSWTFRRKS